MQPENGVAVNQQIAQSAAAHAAEKRNQHRAPKIQFELFGQNGGGDGAGDNADDVQRVDDVFDFGQGQGIGHGGVRGEQDGRDYNGCGGRGSLKNPSSWQKTVWRGTKRLRFQAAPSSRRLTKKAA